MEGAIPQMSPRALWMCTENVCHPGSCWPCPASSTACSWALEAPCGSKLALVQEPRGCRRQEHLPDSRAKGRAGDIWWDTQGRAVQHPGQAWPGF